MNRSNPSTVLGGGEMKRETSSAVRSAKSDGASDARSSLRVTVVPASIGRLLRQSVLTAAAADGDNIVWGTSADADVTWGSDAGTDVLMFSDEAVEPLPSLQLEFGDVVPLVSGTSGLSTIPPAGF